MRVAATLALMILTGTAVGTAGVALAQEAEAIDAKSALSEATSILKSNPTDDAVVRAIDLLRVAADGDNTEALRTLGEIYFGGKHGVAADAASAAEFYERAIALDDNAARRTLAGMLIAGNGIAADPARAIALLETAADRGDSGAALTLARVYSQGREGIPQDGAKALERLEPLAEAGGVSALTALGHLFRTGATGVAEDPSKAAEYFQRAVDLDSNEARRALASLYLEGAGVSQDFARAIDLLSAAAEAGDGTAFATLGRVFTNGTGGAPVDGAKAVAAYDAAIASDYAPARIALAKLYSDGDIVPADPERAVALLEEATAEGDAKAIVPLAKLVSTGQGDMPPDGQRALDLLQPLAAGGDTTALVALGDIYTSGAGTITADPDLAFEYYSQASELGATSATKKAATFLTRGVGTSPNLEAAVGLLEPLAKAGDPGVYLTLGDMFSRGEVTKPDLDRASSYYRLAADAGDMRGIVRLAGLLGTGALGVPPDGPAAVQYYEQAVADGDNSARRGLAALLYAGRVVRRDTATAIGLLKDAAVAGDANAALTLGRWYSDGGAVAPNYEEAKSAFERAAALGIKTAPLNLATALMGPQLGRSHTAEGQELLLEAVQQRIPGARSTLARLQATGKFPGADAADAIATLEEGVAEGDVSATRYLIQIYRDGLGRSIRANPGRAAALLDQVSATLPSSVAVLEAALMSVKTTPSLATFATVTEQLGQLQRNDALSLIRRLRTMDANAYTYLVQDYLARRGYYDGPLNGLLTNATIRAFNAACADANMAAACDRGPLSSDAGNVISQLMLLPESPEDTDGDIALLAPTLPGSYPVASATVSGDWTGRWSYVTTL